MDLTLASQERCEVMDITANVQRACRQWGGSGAVLVYCPHTTGGVTLNEKFDPTVRQDLLHWMERLVPAGAVYAHAEGNADAHIKASLTGSQVLIPVRQGNLLLGRWQGLFFLEFDGPRHRTLWLSFLATAPQEAASGK